MLLQELLNEDKLLKLTKGTGSLFQILMTLSVKKQALTLDEVQCETHVISNRSEESR